MMPFKKDNDKLYSDFSDLKLLKSYQDYSIHTEYRADYKNFSINDKTNLAYRVPFVNGDGLSPNGFRIVGQPSWRTGANRDIAIQDFFSTGQIRGTENYDNKAFFNEGRVADTYLKSGGVNTARRNWVYEISPDIAENNPLYNRYGPAEGIRGEYYNTLDPNDSASFSDRINPKNRKGIKLTQFDVGETKKISLGSNNYYYESSLPTNNKIVYDRLTPFSNRPLSTHIANISTEAKIIGNLKIPYTPSGMAGAGMAIGAAYTPFQLYEQIQAASGKYGNNAWDKEYGKSDPLALRAVYDAALGNQSPAGNFEKTITSPEYAQRNPIGATVYGTATGNMEYPKAFINAYLPNSMQLSDDTRYERVGIYKGR